MRLNKFIFYTFTLILLTSTAVITFTASDYFGLLWMIEMTSGLIIGGSITVYLARNIINSYFAIIIYSTIGLSVSPRYIFHTFFEFNMPSDLFKIHTLGIETFFKFLILEISSILTRVGLALVIIYSIHAAILLKNILLKNK